MRQKTEETMEKTHSSGADRKITVIVAYTGHDDFEREFAAQSALASVKAQATHTFGLEPSAGSKYGLQFNGTDFSEQTKIVDFHADPLKLTLVLLEDQTKG